jgi:hypothetical protein
LVRRVKEAISLAKLKPMLSDYKADVPCKLPTQTTGKFLLMGAGEVVPLQGQPSLLSTEHLEEEVILALARSGRSRRKAKRARPLGGGVFPASPSSRTNYRGQVSRHSPRLEKRGVPISIAENLLV